MANLFSPLRLGGLDLPNRIIIAPMEQYSAEGGRASDWHVMHWGTLAVSGAGLLIIEATAVSPQGRCTGRDLGLYDDATVALSKELERHGAAAIHVSSGGLSPEQKIVSWPNYQVPFAEAVKTAVSIPVVAVGLITDPDQADAILAARRADAVSLARAMLFDPRWPWPYWRAPPHGHKDLFVQARYGER